MKGKNCSKTPRTSLYLADSSLQHLQMLQGYIALTCQDLNVCGTYQLGKTLIDDLLTGRKIDLIITDCYLCDMDAAEFIRKVQELKLESPPKILCALENGCNSTEKDLPLKSECYIIKPYHMKDLILQARALCGEKATELDVLIAEVLTECGLTEQRMAPYSYSYCALTCILTGKALRPTAKEIYNQIAVQEIVTISAVETALRRASAQAFRACTEEYLSICRRAGKTTEHQLGNGAFLEMLTQEIRRRMKSR